MSKDDKPKVSEEIKEVLDILEEQRRQAFISCSAQTHMYVQKMIEVLKIELGIK